MFNPYGFLTIFQSFLTEKYLLTVLPFTLQLCLFHTVLSIQFVCLYCFSIYYYYYFLVTSTVYTPFKCFQRFTFCLIDNRTNFFLHNIKNIKNKKIHMKIKNSKNIIHTCADTDTHVCIPEMRRMYYTYVHVLFRTMIGSMRVVVTDGRISITKPMTVYCQMQRHVLLCLATFQLNSKVLIARPEGMMLNFLLDDWKVYVQLFVKYFTNLTVKQTIRKHSIIAWGGAT